VAPRNRTELVTVEQLERLPQYRECELWDGIPVVKEASGGESPWVGARLLHLLAAHVEERDLGWYGGADVGFLLRRDPDRMLSPDLAFVSYPKCARPPPRGFAEVVPDFLSEVRSPTQTWREVFDKGVLWRSHGVPVVWLVDLTPRIVVLRPGEGPVEVGPGEIASAAPALPEFRVGVDDLFRRGPRKR
jgi:Uma2 family endonuclease